MCRQLVVGNEPLMERLATSRFDLAVVDGVLLMKCIYLIPHRLGLPFVTYADVPDPFIARVPWIPSFVPTNIGTFTDRMSFLERMKNTVTMLAISFVKIIPDLPTEVNWLYFPPRASNSTF